MKRLVALLAVASAFASSFASAQMKPEDAIKHRKAAFNVIAYNFGSIGAMVNNRKPYNKDEAVRNAATASAVAWQPYDLFLPGTDAGDTKAKPNIWTEGAKFKAAGEKMQSEMSKLASVARDGDVNTLKAQFGEVGKTCKACHDDYRKE